MPRKATKPTAAVMPISKIIIGKRFRRDMGDIKSLAASIRDVGLLQPVVVRSDHKLIAGERRIRAYQLLKRDSIPVHVIDIDKIVRGEYAENTERENFTLTEAVAIKRAVEPQIKAEAQQRKVQGGKLKSKAGANLAHAPKGKTRDLVAKRTGKSRTTLAKAEALVAALEAEPHNVKIKRLVEAMEKSGRADAPYRRLTIMKQAKAIRAEPPPLPGNGPYRGGMIDIPWAYEPDDDSPTRGVLPYPTLSIAQACALDIDAIMHADAALFMWVTNFILARGLHLKILSTWGGFEPKTIITWPKARHTFKAHWLRGQTEHIVMAVRGKPVIDLTDADLSTLLRGPFRLVRKGEHSAKPVEAYDFVERLCPAPRYCDLFSRYQHNDKWDCHGDQAPLDATAVLGQVPGWTALGREAQP
jgi:N6-adenosine-specific RNA methylase IME4